MIHTATKTELQQLLRHVDPTRLPCSGVYASADGQEMAATDGRALLVRRRREPAPARDGGVLIDGAWLRQTIRLASPRSEITIDVQERTLTIDDSPAFDLPPDPATFPPLDAVIPAAGTGGGTGTDRFHLDAKLAARAFDALAKVSRNKVQAVAVTLGVHPLDPIRIDADDIDSPHTWVAVVMPMRR